MSKAEAKIEYHYDEEMGAKVPCCPRKANHHLSAEPRGYYCYECAEHYLEGGRSIKTERPRALEDAMRIDPENLSRVHLGRIVRLRRDEHDPLARYTVCMECGGVMVDGVCDAARHECKRD